MRTTVLFYI
ncbi:hypothetical protein SFRURICE_011724 [Spodoptera frugiperda]|nr:hypothetical protein SFRURICE_011724 [Spodoptera frugiperda]